MPSPTLDAYRQLHPTDTRPDSVVVPELVAQLQQSGDLAQFQDLAEYAGALQRRSNQPPLLKEFVGSAIGGTHQAEAQFFSMLGQGADALGALGLRDWTLRKYQQEQATAAQHQPTLPSYKDVQSVPDAIRYGVGLVGSQAPNIAAAVGTTMAGAAIGSVVGPEGTLAGALAGIGRFTGVAKTASRAIQAAAGGAEVGALVGGYEQNQNYSELALKGGEDPLITSAAVGIAGGLVETVVPAKMIRMAFGAEASNIAKLSVQEVIKAAERKLPGFASTITKALAEEGGLGAGQEVAQELITMGGELYSHRNDPNFKLSDEEIVQRILENAVGGSVLGATFGIAGGLEGRRRAQAQIDLAKELLNLKQRQTTGQPAQTPLTPQELAQPTPTTPASTSAPTPAKRYADYINPYAGLETEGVATAEPTPVDQFLSAPRTPVAQPVEPTTMPGWVRQEMVARGLDPARPLNDIDVQNPSVVEAINADPTLSPEQKKAVLETGSPKVEPKLAETATPVGGITTAGELTGELTPVDQALAPARKELGLLPETPPPMEFGGDIPLDPMLAERPAVTELPTLRTEITRIKPTATVADVLEAVASKTRVEEYDKKSTTKNMLVVEDTKTGKVIGFPVYRSTGHRYRLDNARPAALRSIDALAGAIGKTRAELGPAASKIWDETRVGEGTDQFVDDFLKDPRYTPVAVLHLQEAAGGKQLSFENRQKFAEEVGWAEHTLVQKQTQLGSRGTEQMMAKMDEVDKPLAQSVRAFASLLTSAPRIQAKLSGVEDPHLSDRAQAAESNPALILQKLLTSIRSERFTETVAAVKRGGQLIRRGIKGEVPVNAEGRLFGLFTDSGWKAMQQLLSDPKIQPQDLLTALDAFIDDAGWKSREAYLRYATVKEGQTELGVQLQENKESAEPKAEFDMTQAMEDTADFKPENEQVPVAQESDDIPDQKEAPTVTKRESESVKIVTGDTLKVAISRSLKNPETEEDIRASRNILEARSDSEISNPDEDLEYQAVRDELEALVKRSMDPAGKGKNAPNIPEDVLYRVYADLDATMRDTKPDRQTFRETSDFIQRTFMGVVNSLADLGVEVNLVGQSVASQVPMLMNEWGRAIKFEDGRRMIILTMSDIANPTKENLRVLLHEAAHHLFANEPVNTRKLIHRTMERLTDAQLDVFSKSMDRRLKYGNPSGLSPSVFLEDVLAEHLSFFGVEKLEARTFGQKLVDGFMKLIARAVLAWSSLRGYNVAPGIVKRYAEIRIAELLDKSIKSTADLELRSGNVRDLAQYRATLMTPVDGGLGTLGFDPDSGNFYVQDVVDDSTFAANFNLDNRLANVEVLQNSPGGEDKTFGKNLRNPISEQQSDEMIKTALEYEFAEHNSQIDFYEKNLKPLATAANIDLPVYVSRVLGISDPAKNRAEVAARRDALNRPIKVNDQFRVTDVAGPENNVPANEDRVQLLKRVAATVNRAKNSMSETIVTMRNALPKLESALKWKQERMARFEVMLHDVVEIRDQALKFLRSGLRHAERNAQRLVEWSARHDHLSGVAAEVFGIEAEHDEFTDTVDLTLPPDVVSLLDESLRENKDTFHFTDVLTALTQHNIDVDLLLPSQIVDRIHDVVAATRDPRLLAVADGSPKAKADLSLLIYYAKTNPVDMVALATRVEKDPARKEEILTMIKKIIRGNYSETQGLNDLTKEVRKGDVRVGKAKRALTEQARQMRQSKDQLETANMKVGEMEKAVKALGNGLRDIHEELGIHAEDWSPFHGAKILLTPKADGAPVAGKLDLVSKNYQDRVTEMMFQHKDWLKAHELKDEVWQQINSQLEGLKKVSGDYSYRNYRDSLLTRIFESLPQRLTALGHPLAKLAANRILRTTAYKRSQQRLSERGFTVTTKLRVAQDAVGFGDSYDGFKAVWFSPAMHFIEHLRMLPSASAAEIDEFTKSQLKQFFAQNEITRQALQKNPAAFEAVYDFISTNAEAAKSVANLAKEWNVLVEDPAIKIVNPVTGEVQTAFRYAMDVGPKTAQRHLSDRAFGIKRRLETIKDAQGNSMWAAWANPPELPEGQTAPPPDYKMLFPEEVMKDFVAPYVYDMGTLHLDAPAMLDGKTRNKANPMNVQRAFEMSNGDIVAFANALFELEYTLPTESFNPADVEAQRQKEITRTIDFFKDQYRKLFNMTAKQERFLKDNLGLLSSPMMDPRQASDFPPEFVDYRIYDHSSLVHMVDSLAAHSQLGRDLGLFDKKGDINKGILWETRQVLEDLDLQEKQYGTLQNLLLQENPTLSAKKIDKKLRDLVGEREYSRLKNLQYAVAEIKEIEREILAYFASPNGSTREMATSQTVMSVVTGFMVNNLRTAISQSMQVFEPFMRYGAGKTGRQQVARTAAAFMRTGAGSIVQGLTGQAKLASVYARHLNERGFGLDPANSVTAAQVIADTGRNNFFEKHPVLGAIRKGRTLVFDLSAKGREGERVAPALRPVGIFQSVSIGANQASMEGDMMLYNDLLKSAVEHFEKNPLDRADTKFHFTREQLNASKLILDGKSFEELTNEINLMGTTLEEEARQLVEQKTNGQMLGEIIVPPHLDRLISSRARDRMSLESDVATAPIWAFTSKVGRMSMPLLVWPINKMTQIFGEGTRENGEFSRKAMLATAATMALAIIPASMAMSILLDQYDEHVLDKKSNLIGFKWDDPAQLAMAFTERLSRVGTFGLAGDVVNGVRVYGTDNDLRGISLDQRVVFMNTLLSSMKLLGTVYNQQGTLTYQTFWRPMINTLGGTGLIQNQQILNNITNSLMGVPVFEAEAQATARINAINYLRGAGRVLDLDVRTGAGMASIPTPIKPWVSEMVMAVYTNDHSQFVDGYQRAVVAAREEGKPDPEDYVKRSFQSYHPLRYVFRTTPSKAEVNQILATLSDKGKVDVQQAIQYFNAYAQTLGLQPYNGRELVANSGANQSPVAFTPVRF